MNTERKDVYSRITSQIVASLEQGVRPWIRPWNAEHALGRITRPLRHNGQPYSGINALALWASAMVQNFAAPIWVTYRQATELGAHVREGEKGSLVAYANSITRTEHDDATGQDTEREIPYMKGYTVFNVEQIDGLPKIYYAKATPTLDPVQRIQRAEAFVAATRATVKHGGNRAYHASRPDGSTPRLQFGCLPRCIHRRRNWSCVLLSVGRSQFRKRELLHVVRSPCDGPRSSVRSFMKRGAAIHGGNQGNGLKATPRLIGGRPSTSEQQSLFSASELERSSRGWMDPEEQSR